MVKDKFGYDHIYMSKPNWHSWTMSDDPENDPRFYIGGNTRGLSKTGSYWECNDNSQVRLNAQTPKTVDMDNSDGGCNMDFSKAEERGHAGMTDRWRDIEMTALINVSTFGASDGRFIMKGPTFHHHSNQVCCSGHAYGIRFFVNTDPMEVQFFKEIWHVNYDSRPDNPVETKFPKVADGEDHLFKFVRYNAVKNGKTIVKLEAYCDFAATGSKFVKVLEAEDAGGWNSDGGRCGGDDDQILTWGSGWCMYRWDEDNTDLKFKNWSAREIDPLAVPDTTPTDPSTGGGGTGETPRPTTQTLVIPLVLSFDVNALRNSPCATTVGGGGGGGGGAGSPYYSNVIGTDETKLSDSSAWSHRKRICAAIADSGSDMYNQSPKTLKVAMRKVGTPNTNNIVGKIWKSGSGTTVQYTSPTTITDASLTGTLAWITYDFGTNSYVMKVGDRIGVEYLGTSDTNYVVAAYVPDTSGNGSSLDQYEGSAWQRKTTRELSCELYL